MSKLVLIVIVLQLGVMSTMAMRFRRSFNSESKSEHPALPPDEWLSQKLDHFDGNNFNVWKQRYQINASWFSVRRNAPVFLMIGGEGPIGAEWMVHGSWLEFAKTYGALCFQLEHRFYGKSHPTKDLSVKYMRYLSSELALADIAYFIQEMNKKYKLTRNNKWVLFGGSYPGSMAAWARMKYPHLVHAAVSTSGPLLAKANFREYFEVMSRSLNTYDIGCSKAINEAAVKVLEMLNSTNGTDIITNKFKLCDRIDASDTDDVYTLYETLSNNIANVVQYNKDRTFSGYALSKMTIDDICLIMLDPSIPDVVNRLSILSNRILKLIHQRCLDFKYSNLINSLKNVSWSSESSMGGRQWTYQTCTEFGFFQTSERKTDLFGPTMPLNWYMKQCIDIFGPMFTKAQIEKNIYRTNIMYGARHIDVSRVVFVHGDIDPWHSLGIVHSANSQSPAILIQGTAHCADMYSTHTDDPPQLIEARRNISHYIGIWLSQGLQT